MLRCKLLYNNCLPPATRPVGVRHTQNPTKGRKTARLRKGRQAAPDKSPICNLPHPAWYCSNLYVRGTVYVLLKIWQQRDNGCTENCCEICNAFLMGSVNKVNRFESGCIMVWPEVSLPGVSGEQLMPTPSRRQCCVTVR